MSSIKITLVRSPKHDKRIRAIITDNETKRIRKVDFGSKSRATFFDIGDEKKKSSYDARHGATKANQDWTDPYSAGFWSKWVLWSHKSNISKIKDEIKKNSKIPVTGIVIGADFR